MVDAVHDAKLLTKQNPAKSEEALISSTRGVPNPEDGTRILAK